MLRSTAIFALAIAPFSAQAEDVGQLVCATIATAALESMEMHENLVEASEEEVSQDAVVSEMDVTEGSAIMNTALTSAIIVGLERAGEDSSETPTDVYNEVLAVCLEAVSAPVPQEEPAE